MLHAVNPLVRNEKAIGDSRELKAASRAVRHPSRNAGGLPALLPGKNLSRVPGAARPFQ